MKKNEDIIIIHDNWEDSPGAVTVSIQECFGNEFRVRMDINSPLLLDINSAKKLAAALIQKSKQAAREQKEQREWFQPKKRR